MCKILDSCLKEANDIDEVERIDSIPKITKEFEECWKINTEIFVNDALKLIELYIGFENDFPYSLPTIYFQSLQFGYLPHIESEGGKLCLFEDGISYKTENPETLVRYCIKKAKKLIQYGAEKKNFIDFSIEISSYWTRRYNKEPEVDVTYLIYNGIPTCTMELNSIKYATQTRGLYKICTIEHTVLFKSKVNQFYRYLSENYPLKESNALFVNSFQVPREAPFEITYSSFMDNITDIEDKKKVEYYINKNHGGSIFFKLTDCRIGGIQIPSVNLKKNGFREGSLKTTDFFLKFEKKNTLLKRLYGSLYSKERIAERTKGTLMTKQKFAIAGLGSVGSNLVHFLNGFNNTSFTLVDKDCLTIDNIGRHLVGFKYNHQYKAHAIADYLRSIRPELEITEVYDSIQSYMDKNLVKLNEHTILFLCTGDTMTEQYVIKAINQRKITIPVFSLWLEPYGAAAHMVYFDNNTTRPIDIFDSETLLYKYNVIKDLEYKKTNKKFTKKDAGCNGSYALYSGNDVLEMLSAFYPVINRTINTPSESKCYRWIGNIKDIVKMGIVCKEEVNGLQKGIIQELPI